MPDTSLSPPAPPERLPKFKLVFFSPLPPLPAIKSAIFATGAGRYPGPGGYTEAAWQTVGTGQFRPGPSARPHIGQPGGELETVEEARVEVLCVGEGCVRRAVEALLRTHPYEEVAYEVYEIKQFV